MPNKEIISKLSEKQAELTELYKGMKLTEIKAPVKEAYQYYSFTKQMENKKSSGEKAKMFFKSPVQIAKGLWMLSADGRQRRSDLKAAIKKVSPELDDYSHRCDVLLKELKHVSSSVLGEGSVSAMAARKDSQLPPLEELSGPDHGSLITRLASAASAKQSVSRVMDSTEETKQHISRKVR